MRYVGWTIMIMGLLMQLLVPLGVFGRPDGLLLGIPTQLALLFIGTWILVIGLLVVYFAWLSPYARRLDESLGIES